MHLHEGHQLISAGEQIASHCKWTPLGGEKVFSYESACIPPVRAGMLVMLLLKAPCRHEVVPSMVVFLCVLLVSLVFFTKGMKSICLLHLQLLSVSLRSPCSLIPGTTVSLGAS